MLLPDPFPLNPRRSITNSAFDASLVGSREYTPKGAGLTPRQPEDNETLSRLRAEHRQQNSGYDMSHTGANATLIGNADLAELRRKAANHDLLFEACLAVQAHLETAFPPYKEGESPYEKVTAALKVATGN